MSMTTRSMALLLAAVPALAQTDYGQGWLPEFNHASKQILALAEAVKGNYMLLTQAGVTAPPAYAKLPAGFEETVTAKAEILQWLKNSQDAVRAAYPKADLQKQVTFFGRQTTASAVFLRLLVHSHEHMGQAIAYARMSGVVPPWSLK